MKSIILTLLLSVLISCTVTKQPTPPQKLSALHVEHRGYFTKCNDSIWVNERGNAYVKRNGWYYFAYKLNK
jgi:hypothetical protein